MKSLFYTLASLVIVLTVASCSSKNENTRDPKARELYLRSLRLLTSYSDSMRNAEDYDEVMRLSQGYEDAVSNLNYEYPPDLGLEISEGENDTLVKFTMQYIAIRDAKIKNIGYTPKEDTDSISETQETKSAPVAIEKKENKEKKESKPANETKEKTENKNNKENKESKEKKENTVNDEKKD